jgi:hypothetical protein
MSHSGETNGEKAIFNFSEYPADALFHDRREGVDRRQVARGTHPASKPERRARPERRRRIDPTTFEKQYSADELEFMNAMQQFKLRTGKTFPSYGEVLQVALALGYERVEEPSVAVSEDR